MNNTTNQNNRGLYPAVPYQKALLQYARANNLKLFTVEDRIKVIARYEIWAAIKN